MRKWSDIAGGILFAALGIFIMIRSMQLKLGTAIMPQPGFFPFIVGIALTILAAILIAKAWSGHTSGVSSFGKLWRPVMFILGLSMYVIISDFAGYIIGTTVLSVIVLHIMDGEKWWLIFVKSIIVALGAYLLFDRLLDLKLPAGIFSYLGSVVSQRY